MLNLFCSKTKVSLVETFSDGRVQLTYKSCLRHVCTSASHPTSKNSARKEAAANLVLELRAAFAS